MYVHVRYSGEHVLLNLYVLIRSDEAATTRDMTDQQALVGKNGKLSKISEERKPYRQSVMHKDTLATLDLYHIYCFVSIYRVINIFVLNKTTSLPEKRSSAQTAFCWRKRVKIKKVFTHFEFLLL